MGSGAGLASFERMHAHSRPTPTTTHTRPFTPGSGLFVNLSTWGGAGLEMLGFDSQRTGATLYAHLRYTKVGGGRSRRGLGWVGRGPSVSCRPYIVVSPGSSPYHMGIRIIIETKKVPKEEEPEGEERKESGAAEATVLGLGVEGGFKLDSQKFDVVKEFGLAVRACVEA